jgi:hypothetical protein
MRRTLSGYSCRAALHLEAKEGRIFNWGRRQTEVHAAEEVVPLVSTGAGRYCAEREGDPGASGSCILSTCVRACICSRPVEEMPGCEMQRIFNPT